MRLLILGSLIAAAGAFGQRIEVRPAPEVRMPGEVDSNSPAFWRDGQLTLLNSVGAGPVLSEGPNQFRLRESKPVHIVRDLSWPAWIEAIWVDPSGSVLGWYHQEEEHLCGAQRPAQPRIGAAISNDGGATFHDLGIVLNSGHAPDCNSKNGYFTGGHGDFSVMLDREGRYFYFLFGNYGGPLASQGVSIARMPYESRFHPVGAVMKHHEGKWDQPGIGGESTPFFPASVSWQDANTDSFWGPSIHWNTHLESYVILMNRSCCTPGFPQFGIYASFNADLGNPTSWSRPRKILDDPGWYPQVLGVGEGGTDTAAGRRARLYVYGRSTWELIFHKPKKVPEN